jgi:hydrogenase-4 component B
MLLVFLGVALLFAGALVAVVRRRTAGVDAEYQIVTVAGCAVVAVAAVRALVVADTPRAVLRTALPGGAWQFGIDPLSAMFLLAISVVGAAAVLFGTVYLAEERGHRAVWFAHGTVALLLAALVLVLTAQAVVPFLMAWEVMAVLGYLLIVTDHEVSAARRGGLLYLVATHAGTLALFAMFAKWTPPAADWTFASLAGSGVAQRDAMTLLVLALFGFGCKAGFVPVHFWLPPAHAAAPTHVSALLSGVVIKTGVYGLLRVLLLLGGAPASWGWAMLAIGSASAVLGVLWALAQHDMKRLLAYHSVENIGIIGIGIGIGALGAAYGRPLIAVMGYAGAVLHTVNHALFKSLLFFGAGVVQRATGTRDMEALGGLGRRLPSTWVAFLIGATAIIGVPPLNGFVSEWLVYLGLLGSAQSGARLRVAALAVPVLALVGALALACFAKVAGVVFLGTPRTPAAAAARAESAGLTRPMLALAVICVVLGVVPAVGVVPAIRAATLVARVTPAPAELAGVIDAAWRLSLFAAALAAVVAMLAFLRRWRLRRATVRADQTWGCGYDMPSPRMQYTASSFAAPLLTAFGRASGVVVERDAHSFATHPTDLVLDRTAIPLWHRVQRAARRLRPLQQGRLYMYLLYVMTALIVLLAYLALES